MLIKAGFHIEFECFQPAPMHLMLSPHPDRAADIIGDPRVIATPNVPIRQFSDLFGNTCTRLVSPVGILSLQSEFLVRDSGRPEPWDEQARQIDVAELPENVLPFLSASRYCETDRLSDFAWSKFGHLRGWQLAKSVCDYVHQRIEFGYHHARSDRSASEGHSDQVGVCRDFAHLAVALTRAMNIPARYCTGYLGDIGVPKDPAPMDFSAWYEVYLDGRWFTLDARHNEQRIGRIVIARGLDATDVAISTSFGRTCLRRFEVITEEVQEQSLFATAA